MKSENDDPQLRSLLREWNAPPSSPDLEDRVLRARQPWWTALWTSYIRIPMPVACCAGIVLIVGMWRVIETSRITAPCQSQSIAATPQGCQSDKTC